MSFQPVSRSPIYLQVAEQIRAAIYSGQWPQGQPLPSERELSEMLGVSRASIREALHVLQAEDLISTGVMIGLRPAAANHFMAALRTHADRHGIIGSLAQEHEEILRAVQSRDGERAAAVVEGHITRFYRKGSSSDTGRMKADRSAQGGSR